MTGTANGHMPLNNSDKTGNPCGAVSLRELSYMFKFVIQQRLETSEK